ncbi:hypothetical protein Tco_0105730 [Tanacetum coccineum]
MYLAACDYQPASTQNHKPLKLESSPLRRNKTLPSETAFKLRYIPALNNTFLSSFFISAASIFSLVLKSHDSLSYKLRGITANSCLDSVEPKAYSCATDRIAISPFFIGIEVPDETLPESFNDLSQVAFSIAVKKSNVAFVQDVTYIVSQGRSVTASYVHSSFKRHFSRPVPSLAYNDVSNNKAAILSATSPLQRNGNSTSREKMQHQGLSFSTLKLSRA